MRPTIGMTLVLAGFVLSGCQSSEPIDADEASTQRATNVDDPEYLGPRVVSSDEAQALAQPIDTIAAIPESAPLANAGSRPEWWFEGVRENDDGRRSVCAEALARDLSDARRQAVIIARAVALKFLGIGASSGESSEQILRTAVAPLSKAKGAEYRYVVYVEVARPL